MSLLTHHHTCTLQNDNGNQNQSASSRQNGVGGDGGNGRWISGITSFEVVRTITHALQRRFDQFTAPFISSFQQLSTGVRSFFTPTQENTLVEFDDALSALRKFYDNNAVQFKSYSQFLAIQQLLANKQDLLLNLGTGQGKTTLVLAVAKEEQQKTLRCCTVYISPLKALADQTHLKAVDSGINAQLWSHDLRVDRYGLVVVGFEQTTFPEYRDWISQMHAAGYLSRVVFDEAHVLLTDAYTYRSSLLQCR